ncbi:hypothetical protein LCGC14_1738790 [marine sediment metagenome]|uniref:Nudix hydrolase domain-containing protein n=1 Tax=marine sediment metagenome TaxID=412755 RepID=A0A0F9K700_9ZZZZ
MSKLIVSAGIVPVRFVNDEPLFLLLRSFGSFWDHPKGRVEDGECAASSQCQSMIGFCSEAHLESWRGQQSGDTNGFSFSAAQALQAGSATFRPFMASDAKPILQPRE